MSWLTTETRKLFRATLSLITVRTCRPLMVHTSCRRKIQVLLHLFVQLTSVNVSSRAVVTSVQSGKPFAVLKWWRATTHLVRDRPYHLRTYSDTVHHVSRFMFHNACMEDTVVGYHPSMPIHNLIIIGSHMIWILDMQNVLFTWV